MSQHKIIVTGFGPFEGHEEVNASWEAVKLLPDNLNVQNIKFDVKKMEIPVVYAKSDEAIQNIWKDKPALVIHCGVGNRDDYILLEKCSFNRLYSRQDLTKKSLNCPANLLNNKTCTSLGTTLKLEEFVNSINQNKKVVEVSHDPGEYLCAYTYLKSLDMDCKRSLFIHVPKINQPFSSKETSEIIYKVMGLSVQQLIEEKLI